MTQFTANPSDSFPAFRNDTLTHFSQPCAWRAVRGLLALLLCGILLLPFKASAQEFRGTISGTITDPSGAVVSGAQVEVRETQTGTVSRTTSDKAGQYVVPFLVPGEYAVTATKAGFEILSRTGITLETSEHPIINLAMHVGAESTTVQVTGEPPLLNTANASVGNVIDSKEVDSLPINGRTPEMLAELAVGVSITTAPHLVRPYDVDSPWTMGGSVNGNTAAETLLDGGPDEDFDAGTAYSAPQDAVREVSIQPFDTDASYGHTISGVINMITKGGTNAYHGTIYEYSALSNLYANTFFNKRANPVTPLPANHYNQYGLTAGGPVWIPKVFNGKDKLFFFFAWEGGKQIQPMPTAQTVPTAAERQGDFSAMLAGGSTYQLYEPNTGTLVGGAFTRTPVPNNCLTNLSTYCSTVANAGITIDPIALAYLNLYPLPNNSSGVSAITNENNYNSNAPNTLSFNSFFGRLDYNLGSRDHVFFDIRHNNGFFTENDYFLNKANGYQNPRWNWGTTLDNVFTLNSTTVFDVRFNSMVHTNDEFGLSAGNYTPTSVGFPTYMQTASPFDLLPQIKFVTTTTFAPDSSTKLSTFVSYQGFADMTKIIGRHTIKAGFDGRQYREHQSTPGDSSGEFTEGSSFVNKGTGASNQPCCGDLAEFEYGLANSGDYVLAAKSDFRSYYVALFAQDDWRLGEHLSLNLGLRYDIDTPYGDKFGRTVSGFNPAAINSASAPASAAFVPTTKTVNDTTVTVSSINTLGGLTFPSSRWGAPYQIQNNKGFWSPRIGFSYSPGFLSKTVLRGGFGIFMQPQTISSSGDAGYINQEGFSATTAFAATSNSNFTYINKLDNPFPGGAFTQPTGSSLGASTYLGSPSAINFLAPLEHDMYAMRWTIGVQQSLPGSNMVEVVYEGNHAVHLPVNNNINATELQYLTTAPFRNQNLATAVGTAVTNPFAGLLPNGSSSFNGATTSLSNLLVPYPAYGSTAITEQNMTIGESIFNSVAAHVEHRAAYGLTLTANYQFARTIEATTYLNPQDSKLFRGFSPNADFRHHLAAGGTYALPFGRGKMFASGSGRLMNELIGGWVVNGVYQFQTGLPVNFSTDIPLQIGASIHDIHSSPRNPGAAFTTTPFVTGSVSTCTPATGQPCDGTAFFNGQYSNHYRTLPLTMGWVRQDGFNNLDASLLKNFEFTKDGSKFLQLRFETFNTLNHPAFASPNVTPTSSSFGTITGIAGKSIPRWVQLGGRIVF